MKNQHNRSEIDSKPVIGIGGLAREVVVQEGFKSREFNRYKMLSAEFVELRARNEKELSHVSVSHSTYLTFQYSHYPAQN